MFLCFGMGNKPGVDDDDDDYLFCTSLTCNTMEQSLTDNEKIYKNIFIPWFQWMHTNVFEKNGHTEKQ